MTLTVYDTLLRYDDSMKPTPELAESWEFGDGGKRLVMKLRKGVTFHSGRDFTAEDVVYNLKRYQDEKVGAQVRQMALYISDVKANDKYTVTFLLDEPNAAILDLFDLLFITDKEAEKDLQTKGVGTGPFKLKSWIPSDKTTFEKNVNYWKEGKPYLDGVELLVVPDHNALAVHVESGAIDIADGLNADELKQLEKNSGIELVIAGKGGNTNDISINTTMPPFDNRKVRAAFDLAIDRKRFNERYWAGLGVPTRLPYPRHCPGYFEDQDKYEFNLEKARELLKEAGVPNLEATVTTSSGSYQPGSDVMAAILQADMKKIGVNLRIEDLPQAQARPKFFERKYQIACHSYGRGNRDPIALLNAASPWVPNPENNITGFKSEKYEQLIKDAAKTTDAEKRKPILRELNNLIIAESFCIPVCQGFRGFPKQKRVQGFGANLDGMAILEGVWLS